MPVSLTPVQIYHLSLMPMANYHQCSLHNCNFTVSVTAINENLWKDVNTGVVDTGGKFMEVSMMPVVTLLPVVWTLVMQLRKTI
jgi:hypothetical protein